MTWRDRLPSTNQAQRPPQTKTSSPWLVFFSTSNRTSTPSDAIFGGSSGFLIKANESGHTPRVSFQHFQIQLHFKGCIGNHINGQLRLEKARASLYAMWIVLGRKKRILLSQRPAQRSSNVRPPLHLLNWVEVQVVAKQKRCYLQLTLNVSIQQVDWMRQCDYKFNSKGVLKHRL